MIDVILCPLSAWSNRPLRSLNRLDLLVPLKRTDLAQSRSFAPIGPAHWNALSPSIRSTFLSGSLSATFASPKPYFFLMGHTGSASERFTLLEALYKCLKIQYNTKSL